MDISEHHLEKLKNTKLSEPDEFLFNIDEIFIGKRMLKQKTQKEFAKWLGIKLPVLKKIEAGKWNKLK